MGEIDIGHEMDVLEGLRKYLEWLIEEHPEAGEEIQAAYRQWAALEGVLQEAGCTPAPD